MNGAATIGRSATPRTWHCIVTAVPTAADEPPAAVAADHARQAPARATALESAMRFGFQMNVDSSTAAVDVAMTSPATSPATGPPIDARQPPHDPDRGDAGQGDERHDRERRVAAGQRRGRRQEVVVPGAVVDVADRGRRAQKRHDAIANERPQDEHVVTLVAVPCPARGEVRQAQERGEERAARAGPAIDDRHATSV